MTAKLLVKERLTYAASLRYEYKENDSTERAHQWKLAGGSTRLSPGNWVEPCANLNLFVKVRQLDPPSNQLLAEKVVKRPCLSSWGADKLDAELLAITLTPGTYEFVVESLEQAPEFIAARTSLHVGRAYRGK